MLKEIVIQLWWKYVHYEHIKHEFLRMRLSCSNTELELIHYLGVGVLINSILLSWDYGLDDFCGVDDQKFCYGKGL